MTEALLKDCTESEFGPGPLIQSCPRPDDSDLVISSNRICYDGWRDGMDLIDLLSHTLG